MTTMPNFRKMITEMNQGSILIPLIRAALYSPDFKGFPLKVEGWHERDYDGWFHPSTHSMWTVRQLTYYLLHGDKIASEPPELGFVFAVTQGKFWHDFFQELLLERGVMVQKERPLEDLEHHRRGHTDGVLSNGELFEFKTASEKALRWMSTPEDLRKHKPDYYGQTQDYLDMAGVDRMRYLVFTPSFPFPMKEFVVHADKPFQAAQRAKYAQALEAARTGVLPDPCCAVHSKESKQCPMRWICPIGQIG